MAPVLHPLLDLPLPDLADLLARATPDGQELLVLAARLAARRLAQQEAIGAAIEELVAPPWLAGGLPWSPPPRGELQATDLLRAVFAVRPDLVTTLVDRADDFEAEVFEADCRPWSDLRHDLPQTPATLTLPRWWARRFALFAGDLDAAACLQNVGEAGLTHLGRFSRRYVEGLITPEEAYFHVLDHMATAGRPANVAPLAPGYLDHFGGLDLLADALLRGPGAVLLGSEGSGRQALLAAFGRRLRGTGEPAALRGFGFNVDNFHGGPMLGTADDPDAFMPPAAVDRRMIYALTGTGFGAALTREPDPTFARLVRHCAALACDPDAEFRLVLAATPHQWAMLQRLAPDLAGLPEIVVPAIPDEQLLAAWLLHTPGVEERAARRVSLAAIVVALTLRDDDDARRDFGRHDDIVAAIDTYRVHRFERTCRTGTPAQRQTQLRRLGRGAWIPDADRLAELLVLERSILGP